MHRSLLTVGLLAYALKFSRQQETVCPIAYNASHSSATRSDVARKGHVILSFYGIARSVEAPLRGKRDDSWGFGPSLFDLDNVPFLEMNEPYAS